MPAPPSFIDITPIPFSRVVTQAEFNGGTFGGTANTVWFRYIAPTKIALGTFTNRGGTFKGDTFVYQSDGTTLIQSNAFGANGSMFVILVTAGTYYIKVVRHTGGASDFDFTTQFDTKPVDVFPLALTADQLIINNDEEGFPAVVLNADGTVAQFLTTVPSGETAAMLPSGESLWHDNFGMLGAAGSLALFDTNFNYVMSVVLSGLTAAIPSISHSDTDFFVMDRGGITEVEFWKVSKTGVVTNLGTTPTTETPSAMGANRLGTVLYWTERTGSNVVHRYDPVGHAAMSDFTTVAGYNVAEDDLAITVNNKPGDILVLPDASVVLWFYDLSVDAYIIRHYSSAGAQLHSCTLGAGVTVDHLAQRASSAFVTTWFFIDPYLAVAQFGRLELATCIVDQIAVTNTSSAGNNLVDDDPLLFPPPESCTFFSAGLFIGGGPGGGPTDEGFIGPIYWLHWHRQVVT